jgi:3-hydroxyisobutyrate dehydrogenase-like beta-hydroxyacid dehydrogenase
MAITQTKPLSLGFIGLGNMGLPIATNLLTAGYQLRVYNRTSRKAEPLIATGAKLVDSAADVIEPGGIVFTMLADDATVKSIAVSNSDFLERFSGGGIHVSMSTIAPETARDLAEEHAKKAVAYLSAPVIGRPDRAAAGALFILLAGESNAKRTVEPLLKSLGQRIFDLGDKPWHANVAKLVVNFNIAAAIECMAEGFTLAEKEGIPRLKISELLSETLFSCVAYKGYGDLVAGHRYEPAGFRLRLGWKDVRLILQTAEESETPMPIGSLLAERFLSALAKKRADLDWSAIALGASDDAGVRP